MEGRKALRDQIVERAEGIRALIGVGGAGDGLQFDRGAEPPRGGILIDRGGRNRRIYAEDLVTDGLYAHSRNPMYVGMAMLLAGWAAWLGTPWAVVGIAAFVAWITRFQIIPEERALAQRFGADFATYQHRVRRWL